MFLEAWPATTIHLVTNMFLPTMNESNRGIVVLAFDEDKITIKGRATLRMESGRH
jgi:hypothetical protein